MSEKIDLTDYEIATRKIIMYPNLSVTGRLFGGQMLSWIDEAVAMIAMQKTKTKNIVTKKISEVVFDSPGLIGDVLEIWCKPAHLGKTSIAMDCTVTVWRSNDETQLKICSCSIIFVVIDENGKPKIWNK
ncbi:MAG: acyl-CoA thioesterase [Planctomycetota bacterium]|nr:MAG: acyl-CoA thioesterase [Planctomycetota bacterium]